MRFCLSRKELPPPSPAMEQKELLFGARRALKRREIEKARAYFMKLKEKSGYDRRSVFYEEQKQQTKRVDAAYECFERHDYSSALKILTVPTMREAPLVTNSPHLFPLGIIGGALAAGALQLANRALQILPGEIHAFVSDAIFLSGMFIVLAVQIYRELRAANFDKIIAKILKKSETGSATNQKSAIA